MCIMKCAQRTSVSTAKAMCPYLTVSLMPTCTYRVMGISCLWGWGEVETYCLMHIVLVVTFYMHLHFSVWDWQSFLYSHGLNSHLVSF